MNNKAKAATEKLIAAETAYLIAKALHDAPSGLDRIRCSVIKLLMRIERLSAKIDIAFAGQPFMPNLPPDAPANLRRCKSYIRLHLRNTELLDRAIRLWMLTFGMKPEDDWTPVMVEHMKLQRARAETSCAAEKHGDNTPASQATAPESGI